MKKDFQAFKNRAAVTKEERLRQRKNCAAIVKDKAARLRGANDNFLITVRLSGSFSLLVTVLFVGKGECVPTFACESKRGPFVREVEKCDEKRLGTAL